MNFDNSRYEHKEEYLHIDQCTYTEYDGNDVALGDQIKLIKDGCDETFGLVSFKGCIFNFILISNIKLDRTNEKKNHEQFWLKPFQLNQLDNKQYSQHNKFVVDCDLRVCKKGDENCALGQTCQSTNRYDIFYNNNDTSVGRRRRDTDFEVSFILF